MVETLPANAEDITDVGSIPGLGRFPEEGTEIHSSILAWRIHGQRGLVGYSLQKRCHKESDMTEAT